MKLNLLQAAYVQARHGLQESRVRSAALKSLRLFRVRASPYER